MTKYTVVWHGEVENALALIWLEANDRDGVSAATAAIDRELSIDAEQKGRPVGDRLRVIHHPPLEVLFDVAVADRMAKVVLVRRRDIGSN